MTTTTTATAAAAAAAAAAATTTTTTTTTTMTTADSSFSPSLAPSVFQLRLKTYTRFTNPSNRILSFSPRTIIQTIFWSYRI